MTKMTDTQSEYPTREEVAGFAKNNEVCYELHKAVINELADVLDKLIEMYPELPVEQLIAYQVNTLADVMATVIAANDITPLAAMTSLAHHINCRQPDDVGENETVH